MQGRPNTAEDLLRGISVGALADRSAISKAESNESLRTIIRLGAIYNRRMNTITQYLRRGTLDEQTAAVMKRLAKDKLERAILDVAYANGSYEKEMEQVTLLKETKKKR